MRTCQSCDKEHFPEELYRGLCIVCWSKLAMTYAVKLDQLQDRLNRTRRRKRK